MRICIYIYMVEVCLGVPELKGQNGRVSAYIRVCLHACIYAYIYEGPLPGGEEEGLR